MSVPHLGLYPVLTKHFLLNAVQYIQYSLCVQINYIGFITLQCDDYSTILDNVLLCGSTMGFVITHPRPNSRGLTRARGPGCHCCIVIGFCPAGISAHISVFMQMCVCDKGKTTCINICLVNTIASFICLQIFFKFYNCPFPSTKSVTWSNKRKSV